MNELVSVVIPTYNRAYCIKIAIESVLVQDYEKMEIIVVDDASTDNTEEVIQSINDSRIRYIRNKENCGAAASRNRGIGMAKGVYIAFQDSDDIWQEGKLKKQIELIQKKNYGMVYAGFEQKCVNGGKIRIPRDDMPQEMLSGEVYPYLLSESYIGTPTMVIQKEILKEINGFDENMKNYEDYDLALRIAKNYKIGYINEVLIKSETSENSIDGNIIQGIISSAYLLRKYEADLKFYNLYERKKAVVYKAASACGILKPIEKFLHVEN